MGQILLGTFGALLILGVLFTLGKASAVLGIAAVVGLFFWVLSLASRATSIDKADRTAEQRQRVIAMRGKF